MAQIRLGLWRLLTGSEGQPETYVTYGGVFSRLCLVRPFNLKIFHLSSGQSSSLSYFFVTLVV
jgi:hypothetical protein